jgi:predicted phosphodiesterase
MVKGVYMKKCIITLICLIALNAYAKSTIADYPVRFAIIGDRTGSAQPGVYEQIVLEVERLKPDFVLTVGDAIQGYSDDSVAIKQEWEEYKNIISKLSMPIYFSPGNHDITTDSMLPFYERYIGIPYYSFDVKGLHFIVLDVSRWEKSSELPPGQLDWLINDLKKNQKAIYTIVFYHKPFWADEIASGKPDTLHSIFRNYGVDAVFNGHTHTYFSGKFDDIMYTDVSTSGGVGDAGPTGILYHFTWVTINKNGISIAPIKFNSVFPWDDVTISDVMTINKIYNSGAAFEKPVFVQDDFSVTDTLVTIKLNNPNSEITLEDTLHWTMSEGWSIVPKAYLVKVLPNKNNTYNFSIKNKKKLYPVPEFSIKFPYAKDKTYEIKKPLPVARKTYCYRATMPPVIDGKIAEPLWQKPVSKLFSPDGSQMKIDSAYFYFAYDENNIYVAALCKESKMDEIATKASEHDGAVYGEDCVGYFFIPNRDTGIIYQIYFNPNGIVFDQKVTDNGNNADREWNGNYEVKTFKGNNYWSIEARIPLDQLQTTATAGQEWGINFRRKQKRLNSAADWQVPIQYDPKSFGSLIMK